MLVFIKERSRILDSHLYLLKNEIINSKFGRFESLYKDYFPSSLLETDFFIYYEQAALVKICRFRFLSIESNISLTNSRFETLSMC